MKAQVKSSKADFDSLNNFVQPFEAKGRTESAAMLIWFLETLYRLDETEAQDAVCDRRHDAGIDALYVSDSSKEIAVFQAKRKERLPSTLGDTDLKSFFGALAQFASSTTVAKLVRSTKNEELKRLLVDGDVGIKIASGYKVRAVFVSNVAANSDASDYLGQAEEAGRPIELWDLSRLGPVLNQLKRDWFLEEKVKLRVDADHLFYFGTKASPRLVYTAVRATELVKLPGIDDSRIFAQNVRLGLGNTRVNKDIVSSVNNKSEHADFLTFHNGLTVVARDIKVRGSVVTLSGLSVCNGCQSLLTFFENRKSLTENLEVLVRVVKVGEDLRLPETISYRTNNQNAISLRDLNSNDAAQLRLKSEFDELYGAYSTYSIKRGDQAGVNDLKNEEAGRMLLALYAGEPTSTHQKYRIFGDLESRIFSIDTTAPKIRLSQIIYQSASSAKVKIKYERLAKYGLTTFVLMHLVGELLRFSEEGRRVMSNPEQSLRSAAAPAVAQELLEAKIGLLLDHAIVELNYYIKDRGDEAYDYKSEFKSPKAVEALKDTVLKAYEKDLAIGRAKEFTLAPD